jgi:hypothetical protein
LKIFNLPPDRSSIVSGQTPTRHRLRPGFTLLYAVILLLVAGLSSL